LETYIGLIHRILPTARNAKTNVEYLESQLLTDEKDVAFILAAFVGEKQNNIHLQYLLFINPNLKKLEAILFLGVCSTPWCLC